MASYMVTHSILLSRTVEADTQEDAHIAAMSMDYSIIATDDPESDLEITLAGVRINRLNTEPNIISFEEYKQRKEMLNSME